MVFPPLTLSLPVGTIGTLIDIIAMLMRDREARLASMDEAERKSFYRTEDKFIADRIAGFEKLLDACTHLFHKDDAPPAP